MTTSKCFERASSTTGPRDLDRIGRRHAERVLAAADGCARVRREHRRTGPLADDLQLADGARSLQVAGDEQRRVVLVLEPARQLAGQRRLSGTLQAREHDDGRRRLRELQPAGLAAEDPDQFLVDDLDDLLSGVQRARDLGALRPLLDPGDEAADHWQRNVGLEQGEPDLATGDVDVRR